jgi:hypothetical protein
MNFDTEIQGFDWFLIPSSDFITETVFIKF